MSLQAPSHIRLRGVNPELFSQDSRLMWQWRNDPDTRAMSHSTNPISWQEHTAWYQKSAHSNQCVMRIVQIDQNGVWIDVGSTRLDLDNDRRSARVSLQLESSWRGKGIGTKMLHALCKLAFQELHLDTLEASIHYNNIASIKIFEGQHFQKISDGIFEDFKLLATDWRELNTKN